MMGSMIQRYIFVRCLMALMLVLGIFAITIMLVDVVEQDFIGVRHHCVNFSLSLNNTEKKISQIS